MTVLRKQAEQIYALDRCSSLYERALYRRDLSPYCHAGSESDFVFRVGFTNRNLQQVCSSMRSWIAMGYHQW